MEHVSRFLQRYCAKHGMPLLDEEHAYVVRFTKKPNLLVEIEVPKVGPDWSVTIRDGTTRAACYSEWYDTYHHATEGGGDAMHQQQTSLRAFLDRLLTSDLSFREAPRRILGIPFGKSTTLFSRRPGEEWNELGSGFF